MTMDNFSSFLESEEYFANPNNSYTPVKGQLGIKSVNATTFTSFLCQGINDQQAKTLPMSSY